MSVDLREAFCQVPRMLHRRLLCFAFQSRYSQASSIWTSPGVFTIGVTAALQSPGREDTAILDDLADMCAIPI